MGAVLCGKLHFPQDISEKLLKWLKQESVKNRVFTLNSLGCNDLNQLITISVKKKKKKLGCTIHPIMKEKN